MHAPTSFQVEISDPDRYEAFDEPAPSPAMYALGGSCSCPNPSGPCECGALLE